MFMKRSLLLLTTLLLFCGVAKAQYLKKGFWGGVELSYGLTLSDKGGLYHQKYGGDTKMQALDLRTVFGYYLTKNFSIGTGVGVATYSDPRINLVPIFIDVRFHPITRINENLYISANVGTSLVSNQSHIDPKLLWELTLGYQLFDLGNCTLTPSIGYGFFKYNAEQWDNLNERLYDETQKRRTLFFRLSLTY